MSANDDHSHETPIKTPKQLIIVVVLAFVVPIALAILLAKLATSGRNYDKDSPAMSAEEVAKRIKPVADVSVGPVAEGTVALRTGEAVAATGKPDGKKVYESTCMACHAAGVANAPKFGDKKAWAPHLARGADELHQSALKGKGAMPPKGGNLTLSEADLKAAVDYMLSVVK